MSNFTGNKEQDQRIEWEHTNRAHPGDARPEDFTVTSAKEAAQQSKPAHNQHPSDAQIAAERQHGRPVDTPSERNTVSGAGKEHGLTTGSGKPGERSAPAQTPGKFKSPTREEATA